MAREFYLFAYYTGTSPFLKKELYMITVHRSLKSYIVRCGKIEKYYSSIQSVLDDWNIVEFIEPEMPRKATHTIAEILDALAASGLAPETMQEIMDTQVEISPEHDCLLFPCP